MAAIGDIVWTWDKLQRNPDGRGWGIYAKRQIVGETRVSWLIGSVGGKPDGWDVVKVPKKKWPDSRFLLSEEAVEQQKWISDNYYWIADALQRYRGPDTYDVLRKVADMINYKEREKA